MEHYNYFPHSLLRDSQLQDVPIYFNGNPLNYIPVRSFRGVIEASSSQMGVEESEVMNPPFSYNN